MDYVLITPSNVVVQYNDIEVAAVAKEVAMREGKMTNGDRIVKVFRTQHAPGTFVAPAELLATPLTGISMSTPKPQHEVTHRNDRWPIRPK